MLCSREPGPSARAVTESWADVQPGEPTSLLSPGAGRGRVCGRGLCCQRGCLRTRGRCGLERQRGFSVSFANLASSESQADGAASTSVHSASAILWSQLTDWPSTVGQWNLSLGPLCLCVSHSPDPGPRF